MFENEINMREFLIPVTQGCDPNAVVPVTGFITIVLDDVQLGTPRSIEFHAVYRPGVPAQPSTATWP
jgi:hypothetical protein